MDCLQLKAAQKFANTITNSSLEKQPAHARDLQWHYLIIKAQVASAEPRCWGRDGGGELGRQQVWKREYSTAVGELILKSSAGQRCTFASAFHSPCEGDSPSDRDILSALHLLIKQQQDVTWILPFFSTFFQRTAGWCPAAASCCWAGQIISISS